MKIKPASNIKLSAMMAAMLGTLAIAAWATTITPAKTNNAGTGVNDPGYNSSAAACNQADWYSSISDL